MQVTHCLTAKRSARNHAFNSFFNHAGWKATVQNLVGSPLFNAARMACMPIIGLGATLITGQMHLFSIDDDDVITAIHIWCVGWLVLTAYAHGNKRSKTPKNEIGCVNDEPVFLDVFWRCNIGPWQRHVIISRKNEPARHGTPCIANRPVGGYRQFRR